MNWWHKLRAGFQALFRKGQLDQEMDEEMRFHLEMRTRQNLESGLTPEQARYAALRGFGGMEQIKEVCRDLRGVGWLETLWQDARFGLRVLRRQPLIALLGISVLALGIAGTTTVFALYNGAFLRPFPVPDQERLVDLDESDRSSQGSYAGLSYRHFHAWKLNNRTFDSMGVCASWAGNFSGEGKAERIGILLASREYLEVLRIRPVLGRPFTVEEDRPGGPDVLLLGFRFWERFFGKNPGVIGQTVRLDNAPFTIIGVLPAEAAFPEDKEVWQPLRADPEKGHGGLGGMALGRLKAGATLEQARADLTRIQESWFLEHPGEKATTSPAVTEFRVRYLNQYRFVVGVLFGAVGFVLLIACSNVAGLMLAQGVKRKREMALRTALGASSLRITRQVLTESLVLSSIGAILGIVLSLWAAKALRVSLAQLVPPWMSFALDFRCVAFCTAALVGAAVVSGVLPFLEVAFLKNPRELIQGTGSGATGSDGRPKMLNAIVVFQIAMALVLLVGAGLFLRSFLKVRNVDPGFRKEGLWTYHIPLSIGPYFDENKRIAFFEQHLEKIQSLPGVAQATLCSSAPYSFPGFGSFVVEGLAARDPEQADQVVATSAVLPGFFETLGAKLLSGRTFTRWDNRSGAERNIIVNETCAKRFWPGEAALGKRIRRKDAKEWMHVVGVVRDITTMSLDQQPWPTVYLPCIWDPPYGMTGIVRPSGDPTALMQAVRNVVHATDPDLPITDVQTMSEREHKSMWARRILAWLFGIPATVSAIMAFAGVYGVMSYAVGRRTQEIGVRIALGARRKTVLALVIGRGIRLTMIGVVVGLGAALALSRVIASFLYEVSPTDTVTFIGISLLVSIAAMVACYIPAYRAARIDPTVALRCE